MGYLCLIEPPKGLEEKILTRVERLVRRRLLAFYSLAGASFLGLLYALFAIGQSLMQSSFYQYLQLIWTDQTTLSAFGMRSRSCRISPPNCSGIV